MRGTSAVPSRSTSRTAFREMPTALAMLRVPCPSRRSRRIAARVVWSSMPGLLLVRRDELLHVGAGLGEGALHLLALGCEQPREEPLAEVARAAPGDAAERTEIGEQDRRGAGLGRVRGAQRLRT